MNIKIQGDALNFLKDFARHANGFFAKEIASAMWYDLEEFRRRAYLLEKALGEAMSLQSQRRYTSN